MVPRSRLSWLTVSLSALAKHLVSCCIRQKKSLPLFILSRSESRQVLNVLIRTGWPSWVHLASSSYISTWIKHRKTQGWRQEVFSRTVQKFLCGRESPATLIVIFSRRVQKFKGLCGRGSPTTLIKSLVCRITTSATGRRWVSGPRIPRPPPLGRPIYLLYTGLDLKQLVDRDSGSRSTVYLSTSSLPRHSQHFVRN